MTANAASLTGIMLYPLYCLFHLAVFFKNFAYNCGWKRPRKFPARTISIGGLTFGGAGKTPMTIFLAEFALKHRKTLGAAAVISRGYRRSSKGLIIVSDGKKLRVSASEAGDELYLLAKRCPQAVVLADETRLTAADYAVNLAGCKIILLDDGFQRRKIHRDTDIVMLESHIVLSTSRFFTREPLAALRRAHAIVILDAELKHRAEITRRIQAKSAALIFWGRRIPQKIISLKDGAPISDEALKYHSTAAFCALANPKSFALTLNSLGIYPPEILAFPDHCRYNRQDLERIAQYFAASQAEILLTTEKDAVKLPPILFNLPIFYLTISLEIEDAPRLMNLIFPHITDLT